MMKSKKAFTLPELLLAAAILAFALSAIILGFITCFVLNEINRNLTLAASHAQYQMEEIKNTPFGSIGNDTINATDGDWPSILEALPDEVMTVTVNPVSGTNGTLLDVNLTVSWNDRGLRARNLSLQTYIAN
jgi:prepilin-type N-terminal cleavage/methylation domain-containing protein